LLRVILLLDLVFAKILFAFMPLCLGPKLGYNFSKLAMELFSHWGVAVIIGIPYIKTHQQTYHQLHCCDLPVGFIGFYIQLKVSPSKNHRSVFPLGDFTNRLATFFNSSRASNKLSLPWKQHRFFLIAKSKNPAPPITSWHWLFEILHHAGSEMFKSYFTPFPSATSSHGFIASFHFWKLHQITLSMYRLLRNLWLQRSFTFRIE